MALAVVMSAVSAAAGSAMADGLLGSASNLTMLSFSRAQEERADADALAQLLGVLLALTLEQLAPGLTALGVCAVPA
jgi:hypothetical protein